MKSKFKTFLHSVSIRLGYPPIQCVWISLLLNLIIESLSRCSLFKGIGFMFTNPVIFLYNTMIIMVTMSLALFFKRRTFAFTLITIFWLIIGITDFVLLQFRVTPFTATDVILIKSALDIWQHYLKFWHLILIALLFIGLIIFCVFVFKKSKIFTKNLSYLKLILFVGILFGGTFGMTELLLDTGILAKNFGNIAQAYHTYGIAYCFSNSFLNTGVDKPAIFSDDVVSTIVDSVEEGKVVTSSEIKPTKSPLPSLSPTPSPTPSPSPTTTPKPPKTVADKETPNIIFLQLESFFDPTRITGTSYTKDPLPTFHALKEKYPSGFLSVPVVGAGTVNTEFEIVTGMNLDFFGPGEYPFKTILQKKTCESISYNLKPLGYSSHVVHNNTGTFYDRNLVYSMLGFDNFTSIEYMQNVERTPLNWAKDAVLTPEITKLLNSTANQDLIYAISTQGHGSYPTTPLLKDPSIDVILSEDRNSSLYYPLLYYVNEIHEMDQFIKDLILSLSNRKEKTILVMYGDHLPSLGLTEEDLTNKDLFQTEYVVWNNFGLEQKDEDLQAYQLASTILDSIDIHEGLITKLHQTQKNSDIYLDELQVLVYDMLYGEMNCYNKINPFKQTKIQMGTDPVRMFSASFVPSSSKDSDGLLVINGKNFTPYSKVYVNEKYYNTILINSSLIVACIPEVKQNDKINIIQSGNDMYELSRTNDYFYQVSNNKKEVPAFH